MSLRYKGAVISATPPTTTGGNSGTAPGAWTLQQQLQAQGAGNWPNQPVWYVEDVFSTWLYTGTGAAQSFNNGIDLAGKGGLVWIKSRSNATNHALVDSARGNKVVLQTNSTNASAGPYGDGPTLNSNGFGITGGGAFDWNYSGYTYVGWSFREQPKFFDVVTYTGTGSARTVAHSLGSAPGFMIVKCTSTTGDWAVYHRDYGGTIWLKLNTTAAIASDSTIWNNTDPTSTVFTVGTNAAVNSNGATYVAYLFAHNAGGFGLTGTDNVISCGSFNSVTGGTNIELGYEPQWVLVKRATANVNPGQYQNWLLVDIMRGMANGGDTAELQANSANAEVTNDPQMFPYATGFTTKYGSGVTGETFIYIAIRRGPMKTPTSGTSVFGAYAKPTSTGVNFLETAFPADAFWAKNRTSGSFNWFDYDRLRGNTQYLGFNTTAAEVTGTGGYNVNFGTSTTSFPYTLQLGETNDYNTNANNTAAIFYWLRRAPGFFDEVCYTGTGSATTQTHNLGVVPEMMIVKRRTTAGGQWKVYAASLGNNKSVALDDVGAAATATNWWNATTPTSTVFSVGTSPDTNNSGSTLVAYLFASCPGVSKVGSYTGTGTTLQIDCGFTGGARFVLIKRTDSTGDWYVWDSARGIVAGNDPYLLLNSTAAEVTNTDYVDTYAAGFEISSTAPAAINANGGTFIYLAIA